MKLGRLQEGKAMSTYDEATAILAAKDIISLRRKVSGRAYDAADNDWAALKARYMFYLPYIIDHAEVVRLLDILQSRWDSGNIADQLMIASMVNSPVVISRWVAPLMAVTGSADGDDLASVMNATMIVSMCTLVNFTFLMSALWAARSACSNGTRIASMTSQLLRDLVTNDDYNPDLFAVLGNAYSQYAGGTRSVALLKELEGTKRKLTNRDHYYKVQTYVLAVRQNFRPPA